MKSIIFILVMVFFVSECNADIRVLEQLTSKKNLGHKRNAAKHPTQKVKAKAKSSTVKSKNPKQKVDTENLAKKEIKQKEIVTSEELDIKNNIAYLPKGDKPFTGKHEELHSNGKRYIVINYKDGKKDGPITMWDENEHKIGELNYKDGERLD